MVELNRELRFMQWASWRIELELNPNTLSESELSGESKKAESLHLCLQYLYITEVYH